MTVTAFVPGGEGRGDVDDEVVLKLLSQRPMIFPDSEEEMRDRVGVLETDVDTAVDHGFPPECAKCCAILFFARTLTRYVGRCRVTHMHARSLWRFGFVQGQGWCGRSPHHDVIACGGMR